MSGIYRPVTKLAIVVSLLFTLPRAAAATEPSLTEMFQKMKTEVQARSWSDALRTLATLQTEAAKPGNEASREKLEAPIAFYRGVCDANLGHADSAVEDFVTFLKLQPNATLDANMHSKQVVAAFEEARNATADTKASISDLYRSFEIPADRAGGDPADQYWADGPSQWILTANEKKEWSRLADPNARAQFVDRFWAARATLPGGESGRTFRQEFERRVAFADVYLVQDPEKRGSVSDRGMVFVLLGPPTHAVRRALRSDADPSEPSGMSRVESQEANLAMKPGGMAKGSKTTTGAQSVLFARFVGAEHRALDTDDEFIEVWQYDMERLPRGVPYQRVDVHYVTKRGVGKFVIQPNPETRNAISAAKSQAAPRPRT
jgi:GWxTD domain-containing protein